MVKIKHLLLILLLFSFTGCQKEKFWNEDVYIISPDEAGLIAERIGGYLLNIGQTSNNDLIIDINDANSEPTKVKIIHTINDKNGMPAFHITNYEKGGFVILSADIRMGPVLSISDIGSFNLSDEYPEGLNKWMSNVKENIEILRAGNTTRRQNHQPCMDL